MIADFQPKLLKHGFTESESQRKVKEQITKGYDLTRLDTMTPDNFDTAKRKYIAWRDETIQILSPMFEANIIQEYQRESGNIGYSDFHELMEQTREHRSLFGDTVSQSLRYLEQISRRLEIRNPSGDIFIVHGHDEAAKESTARFIENLGLSPIILHEQPNAGRTIIEKFEAHSNVGFAVVLLTPDDIGAPQDQRDEIKSRARQNVILELGYFMGKLGRGRVCALYKEGVEIPSDYQGVLYIPMDAAGAWKMQLAKEIKNAGIDVDVKKVL